MGLYEGEYDTEWTSLDNDEATERAYALGVAEALGEYNREEFEAVHAEPGTAYGKSMVELAFREGKNEGREYEVPAGADDRAAWRNLVEGQTVAIDEDDIPTGGRDGIPKAVDKIDAIERPNPDEVDATERPDFLDK